MDILLKDTDLTIEELVDLETAKYEYCATVFQEELERKERIEGKSQFYLSFITVLLGAFFLNLDFLAQLPTLISQSGYSLRTSIASYSLLLGILVSLFVSLVAVFKSIQLQNYKSGYPLDIVKSLFAPNSDFAERADKAGFLKAVAMNYAIALEFNSKLNEKKARWVKIASSSILMGVILLIAFLVVLVYLSAN